MKPAIKIVFGCFTIIIFSYIVYFIVLRTAVKSNNNWFDVDDGKDVSDVHRSQWPLTKQRWGNDVKRILEMSPKVELSPGDSVFEVGCGTCAFLDTMVKIYPNVKLYGSDINESAVQRCKKKYTADNFIVGDLRDVTMNRKFDCIIGNGMLGYLPSHDVIYQTLEKCDAMLKPGKTMRFTMLDYPCSVDRFLTFRCPASSARTSIPPSLFRSFAKQYNYNVYFSDMNVMNGQEGRRYVVVLYKKQK